MIYIVCFVLSAIMSIVAYRNEKKKKIFYFFSSLSILIPTLLGGLRDVTVGTDVQVYVLPSFKISMMASNLKNFYSLIEPYDLELFFKILTYYSSIIFKNINGVLLVENLFICSFIYISAYSYKDKANPTMIFISFLLLYYNMSLNIIRQFLALSIVMYSIKYVFEEKKIKFIICIGIATLFHSTAILALSIYVIKYISNKKYKIVYSAMLIVILGTIMLNYNNALNLMVKFGMVAAKYTTRYAMNFSNPKISIADEIIRIYLIGLMIIESSNLKKDRHNTFFIVSTAFDFIIYQIGIFVDYASRISLYFSLITLINISRIIKLSTKNKQLITFTTIVVYTIYFIYTYIYCGVCETYPYILGI